MNDGDVDDDLVPPPNFSSVEDGIFRSGFPQPSNFPFLKNLNLRSIMFVFLIPYLGFLFLLVFLIVIIDFVVPLRDFVISVSLMFLLASGCF